MAKKKRVKVTNANRIPVYDENNKLIGYRTLESLTKGLKRIYPEDKNDSDR